MQNLDDLFFFTKVVEHGGFAPAGRALRQAKSKLSRRVAQLEARLGVRLIERSTRRFRVTEIGQGFYERCRGILTEIERAEALAAEAQGEPRGLVRMSCPTGLVGPIGHIVHGFLARYPRVRLQLLALDRAVVLIDERVDIAVRVRTTLDRDAELSIRTLDKDVRILVAAGAVAKRARGATELAQLADLPTLSSSDDADPVSWTLVNDAGGHETVRHHPRLACTDFAALRAAAVAGLGVAMLPEHTCHAELQAGGLVRVFPDWHGVEGIVHLVFTTRRGLPPAVRALIDHIAKHVRPGAAWA
jgi:DNA-binding transcriptional LysR family regulator